MKPIQLEFVLIDDPDIGTKILCGLSNDGNTYKMSHINGEPATYFIYEHGATKYSGYLFRDNITGWYDFITEV